MWYFFWCFSWHSVYRQYKVCYIISKWYVYMSWDPGAKQKLKVHVFIPLFDGCRPWSSLPSVGVNCLLHNNTLVTLWSSYGCRVKNEFKEKSFREILTLWVINKKLREWRFCVSLKMGSSIFRIETFIGFLCWRSLLNS